VLKILQAKGKLDADTVKRTKQFIQENRFDGDKPENGSKPINKKVNVCFKNNYESDI